jgi:hypothetical protein
VRLLLQYGSQSNIADHTGCTPLHMAARYGGNEDSAGEKGDDGLAVVRLLVEHKAMINSVMLDGSTPLLLVPLLLLSLLLLLLLFLYFYFYYFYYLFICNYYIYGYLSFYKLTALY